MAIDPYMYGAAPRTLLNGEWSWNNDPIMAALCTSSYAPNQDTDEYVDPDMTDECAGGAYVRVELTTKTVDYDAGTNTQKLSCDPIVFPGLTAADIAYVVIFADVGADTVSPLICYFDLGGSQATAGVDFTLSINALGLITVPVT